jgi:predicted nucleotidyltransferase
MNLEILLNTRMVNLEPEELEWMMNQATFGEMSEYIRDEHQHLRDLFKEIVFEINTMEMLNFIGKDNDED